jgi:hypothetical protein
MKLTIKAVVASALVMASATASFANCFGGILRDNDYCVSCARRTFKVNYCPGGEPGRITVGRQYPDCTVSFYDRATCRLHRPARMQERQE